ncbi:unnamed protein product [Adineta steineri]|uniref:Uncharacterized protein n=1 Tax=Adineta steineri TaxID=433720 RepID=A0A813PD42_9BILA|nr:unnamed protein product [Adineta steineri]CAF0738853.1 unnamed protein product [Adineta steineri]CAF0748687.1 unnamed protein product [Adineta steineri]
MSDISSSWEDLIIRHSETKLKSRTCSIFNINSSLSTESDKLCPCDRMIRRHSLIGECLQSKAAANGNTTWEPPTKFLDNASHSTKVPINVYGTLQSVGCKFIRVDSRVAIKDLFQLVLEDSGGQKPDLIISVYGGAKYFTMTERLEKEFIRGVIDAATMADAWILTAGINNGVSKLVGEGISHYRLLREYSNKVKCIGMTMWGTINETTRLELKGASQGSPRPLCQRQIPESAQENKETIELNHTHCILFDSGRLNEYLSDSQRHQFVTEACEDKEDHHACYSITIIVEGGLGSLEIVENDIHGERPIVLIQGSGRIADVLATLVEQTSNPDGTQDWDPSKNEVEQALDRFYPNIAYSDKSSAIKRIQEILKEEHRHLLHVFSLDRDKNVSERIFKAIFTAKNKKKSVENTKQNGNELLEQVKQRRNDEDKLVDLALKWNYFDGVLPILQARQGEMARKKHDFMKADIARQKALFLKSLEKNRATFIEYFLSAGFDPLTLAEKDDIYSYQLVILNLYNKSYQAMNVAHKSRVMISFGTLPLESIKQLDYRINKLIGSFFGSVYSANDDSFKNRLKIDLSNRMCTCCVSAHEDIDELTSIRVHGQLTHAQSKYTKHHMFRDLFLWSVFMDMPEITKVLFLHVRSRICAALIASAIFKKYASLSHSVDMTDKFQLQALEFETYAAISLDKCYECNDERACELLLRQLPIFGNVTCMQLAISSESGKLLETACFDQTLNHVWFDKLGLTNRQRSAKLSQIPSVISLGFLAPWLITYRKEEKYSINHGRNKDLSQEGIDYYTDERKLEGNCSHYWARFRYFHQCPMIKMAYHFISYIWFLLVFSYMMLYQLDSLNKPETPHWTEIYVIMTVTSMSVEEARKLYYEYDAHMTERWGSTGSIILTILSNVFYILPYGLFYFGLGFRYASYNDNLLSTARIVWALDLELWYIRSLKFVMALKFLGPKLFMLKNMLRDLFAFVYMIFIAIAAYGVVSRSLIFYNRVEFSGRAIFSQILYEPYWFVYGAVSDKEFLENQTDPSTSSSIKAEATATHVLLAFHMLFINILLLNLLVAVFADSIVKVQENTEFYWRYQRYSFVREYFERLPFAYPPLILVSHFMLFLLTIRRTLCPKYSRNRAGTQTQISTLQKITPIFKMIPIKSSQNEQWDLFENAATYGYARSILEKHRNKDISTMDDEKPRRTLATLDSNATKPTTEQQQTIGHFKEELLSIFASVVSETHKSLEHNNSKIENRLDQMNESLERLMDILERTKKDNRHDSKVVHESSSTNDNSKFTNSTTSTIKKRTE